MKNINIFHNLLLYNKCLVASVWITSDFYQSSRPMTQEAHHSLPPTGGKTPNTIVNKTSTSVSSNKVMNTKTWTLQAGSRLAHIVSLPQLRFETVLIQIIIHCCSFIWFLFIESVCGCFLSFNGLNDFI